MKKLIALIGLAVCLSANAQSLFFSTNNMATGLRTLVNRAVTLQSLAVTATTNQLIYLYDGASTYVTAAYTNYTTFVTNQVTTFVSVQTGITNTYTNTVLYSQATLVAAATNATPPLLTLNVGANTAPLVFSTPLQFTRYLNLSNSVGGTTLVIGYDLP